MITLVFIRHGEAEDIASLGDRDRRLTPSGERRVTAVAQALSSAGFTPELILSSDARRTKRTTELICEADTTRRLSDIVRFLSSLYSGDYEVLLEELTALTDAPPVLYLVGHNPTWSDVVSSLTGRAVSMSPGDACVCVYDGGDPLHLAFTSLGQWRLAMRF